MKWATNPKANNTVAAAAQRTSGNDHARVRRTLVAPAGAVAAASDSINGVTTTNSPTSNQHNVHTIPERMKTSS
jgi:hypothetical protein